MIAYFLGSGVRCGPDGNRGVAEAMNDSTEAGAIHATTVAADHRGAFLTNFANSRRNDDLASPALKCFREFRYGLRIAVRVDVVSK